MVPTADSESACHNPAASGCEGYSALILNYNHWQDTIACAKSLMTSNQAPKHIVICDNGSADDSVEQLQRWADELNSLPSLVLTRAEALTWPEDKELPSKVLLVTNGKNLGYAGGNNVGLVLLLRAGVSFVWLLNNDVVVRPNAAGALLEYMDSQPRCGLCGALTRYQDEPEIVQCFGGGWYNKTWGLSGLWGDGQRLPLNVKPCGHSKRLDYVNGASVFARKEFLLDVGLMEECYFLYCEEVDWAERAKGRWELGWTPGAEVLHREGLSTGTSNKRGLGRSCRSSFILVRSRLLFTCKFFPWRLPLVILGQLYALLRKLALGLCTKPGPREND